MLITERTSDGRTVVRIHRDWHPSRISSAYIPPQRSRRYDIGDYRDAEEIRVADRLQRALLAKLK